MSGAESGSAAGRQLCGAAFVAAAVLLLIGALVGLDQWHVKTGQGAAVMCLVGGLLLFIGATFFWLVAGPEKTVAVVAEGQILLGTGAGVILVLWGQAFIALGFIASWRLLYPPKQALPGAPGVPESPSIGDLVQLIQALTVAPTWLGMTVVGVGLTGVGVWVIRHSQRSEKQA